MLGKLFHGLMAQQLNAYLPMADIGGGDGSAKTEMSAERMAQTGM